MPTIKDVARVAKVTPATVSYVLNDSAPVSDQTRARVLAAVAELGYVPHQQGRNFQRQRTATLGLILDPSAQPTLDLAPFLVACVHATQQRNYGLLVTTAHQRGLADGWIVFDPTADVRGITIWAVQPPYAVHAPSVVCDGSAAVQRAVQSLVTTHEQRIALIMLPRSCAGYARWYLGYRRALQQAHIAFDPMLVIEPATNTIQGGTAAWEALSELDQPVDAVIACSAPLAYGVQQAMERTQRRTLIAGADHPLVAGANISALQWNVEIWAETLVERLIALIDGQPVPQRTWLMPTLVIRG